MSLPIKPNNPLVEILARKLFGIEGVPQAEQKKMVTWVIKAAFKYHMPFADKVEQFQAENERLKKLINSARIKLISADTTDKYITEARKFLEQALKGGEI